MKKINQNGQSNRPREVSVHHVIDERVSAATDATVETNLHGKKREDNLVYIVYTTFYLPSGVSSDTDAIYRVQCSFGQAQARRCRWQPYQIQASG